MAFTVDMEPLLQREVELAAKRLVLTAEQFIIDAIEQELKVDGARGLLPPLLDDATANAQLITKQGIDRA